MKKVAVVTGASSGLGRDFALRLDELKEVDEIFLIARRKELLESLAKELKHTQGKVFPMDLTRSSDLESFFERELAQKNLVWLVNNAGFGSIGEFCDSDLTKNLKMIELNISSLVEVTQRALPYIKKGGRIVQVASSAGFAPLHNFAVYAATKAFVLNFSRALSSELKPKNIFVTAVCPGPVATEFFDVAGGKGFQDKSRFGVAESKKVVRKAISDAKKKKLVSVYGVSIRLFVFLTRLLPTRLVLYISKNLER